MADRAGEGLSAASATWIGGGWLLGQLATNTLPREIPVATYIKTGDCGYINSDMGSHTCARKVNLR